MDKPAGMIAGLLTMAFNREMAALGSLFIIGSAIVYLVGIFSIKSAMEEYYTTTENIGLRLSGVMTSFSARFTFSITSTALRAGRKQEC